MAHGWEVWTSPGDTKADPIATRIYKSGKRTFPSITGRPDLSDGDPDKEARFKVLTGTTAAAVLVETAFITNPREEAWLADPGFRLRMAGAIVTGVGRGA
jgi:N-acetylmuramoyl-L-alanine amidase